jgi:arabinogalactan oligomer/maltooligosaccharide transport system permease protein
VPEGMATRMQARGCFACHLLGEQGREGLGGDLRGVGRLGKEKIHAFLANPTGAMQRRTVWLFGRQLLNSLIVALCTTILGIFLATTAAYAFSRFRFPGRRAGLLSFLVIQMFPGTMMMIPLYILVSSLGLLDQLLGLILVYSTTAIPFCVWMLKGYFDTIPRELEESAIIDGASRLRIFWSIILPLAKPAIAVTGLFSFMTAWNEFILAATFMNDETAHTLPVMLNGFVSATTVEWGHFAAGAIIVSIPVVALFFLLQRHLVSGLTAGGVKG